MKLKSKISGNILELNILTQRYEYRFMGKLIEWASWRLVNFEKDSVLRYYSIIE